MRHHLTLLAALGLLITTAARTTTGLPFAGDDAYATLLRLAPTIPQPYLYTATTALALGALLLYAYHTKHTNTPPEALLVIAFSPAFLTAAITNPEALLLGAGSVALLVANRTWAGPALAALLGLIHPAGAVPALIYVAAQIVRKHQLRAILTTALTTAALLVTTGTMRYATRIAELQSLGASSALILLLAITGALLLWDENTYPWLLAALTAAAAALIIPELRLVAAFAAAIPAGHALHTLRRRTWTLETIKSSALLFVLLGLLFTAVSASAVAVRAPPTPALADTADIARELAQNKPVFALTTNEYALRWHGVNTTTAHQETILSLRDSDQLKAYTTEFLIIEEKAASANLRFVLENSNSYVLLYRNGHEIWREV